MYFDKNEFYVYPKILADTWWPRWICCSFILDTYVPLELMLWVLQIHKGSLSSLMWLLMWYLMVEGMWNPVSGQMIVVMVKTRIGFNATLSSRLTLVILFDQMIQSVLLHGAFSFYKSFWRLTTLFYFVFSCFNFISGYIEAWSWKFTRPVYPEPSSPR